MNRQSDKLPAGWKWAALGEIILGKPQYGSAARKVPYNGKVRYVRITDLTDRGELKPDDPVSPSVVQPDRFLEPGDLLIARSGSVGRTYLHGNLPGTYQYAGYLIRFRIDPAKSLPGYVFYVSKSDLWREWIVSNSKTSTLTNINAKQYSSFRLPLPPLPEQKRIAALLNQQMAYVEKARKAAEEILEAAQALPGAFLRQAFPAHGDALPAGWKWAALGEIILGKPQYGSVARKVPYNGKVRYVRITDLTDRGELKPDDPVSPSVVQPDRFLEPGDLLIARSGSVGRTYLHGNLPGTYQYAGYLIRFRIDPAKSLPGYVFYVSKSDLWREWIVSNSKTSTLTNINAKQYSSFRLPLPPLTEQKRIAALLKEQMAYVETVRMSAREQLDAINALPAALLRRAFAGTL